MVNGQRVNKARLESGDQLQFGNTIVVVEVGAEVAQQGEPMAQKPAQAAYRAPAAAPAAYAVPQQQLPNPFAVRRSRRRTRSRSMPSRSTRSRATPRPHAPWRSR